MPQPCFKKFSEIKKFRNNSVNGLLNRVIRKRSLLQPVSTPMPYLPVILPGIPRVRYSSTVTLPVDYHRNLAVMNRCAGATQKTYGAIVLLPTGKAGTLVTAGVMYCAPQLPSARRFVLHTSELTRKGDFYFCSFDNQMQLTRIQQQPFPQSPGPLTEIPAGRARRRLESALDRFLRQSAIMLPAETDRFPWALFSQ